MMTRLLTQQRKVRLSLLLHEQRSRSPTLICRDPPGGQQAVQPSRVCSVWRPPWHHHELPCQCTGSLRYLDDAECALSGPQTDLHCWASKGDPLLTAYSLLCTQLSAWPS